jgi:hypothetical protein
VVGLSFEKNLEEARQANGISDEVMNVIYKCIDKD